MVKIWHNIKYDKPQRCLLDVYRDVNADIGPTIICTHGGSWMLSNKHVVSNMSKNIEQTGILCYCSILSFIIFQQ